MARANQLAMITRALEEITSEQIANRIVLRKVDALVKTSSSWNGASQMLCYTLQNRAAQYSHKVDFFSLNNERESTLSDTYGVNSAPAILYFKTLVDKLSGLGHRTIIFD